MGRPKKALSKKARKLSRRKGIAVVRSEERPHKSDEPNCHGEEKILPDLSDKQYSIDQILDRVDGYIETYEYELARKFCQRALEMDNDNVRALETTASLLLEVGDLEAAKQCLGRAITVRPDTGHQKYLSMAQLLEGADSLELYRKALEVIKAAGEAKVEEEGREGSSSDSSSQHRLVSNCYCAIAELYMTDLCDLDEAEEECNNCIQKAIEADEMNPEAWQTKARLLLVRSDFEGARVSIKHSTSLWLPAYVEVLQNKASSMMSSAFDPVEVCPLLYSYRLSTVKILIELEEWETALQILDGLTEEDEDVVETWYLLGWLNQLRADLEVGEDSAELADKADGFRQYARFYLTKAIEVNKKHPTDDEAMVAHAQELLAQLGDSNEDDNEGGSEWEEWDSSSSEEQVMDEG